VACAGSLVSTYAQQSEPKRSALPMTHPLQDKNFYLCTLIEQSPAVQHALRENAELRKIQADRDAALAQAVEGVHNNAAAYVAPFLWTPEQIAQIADILRGLYRGNVDVRAMTDGRLLPSGIGPGHMAGADLLAETWKMEAAGMNHVIETYAEGKPPMYASIDGLVYDAGSQDYREFLHVLAQQSSGANSELFFAPSMRFSLGLLKANQRDEAARMEPLEKGPNAAALARLKSVDWSRYRYSVILVPGIGPEIPSAPLSPMGSLHVAAAAALYHSGKAPFLLLSGGFVHPRQTQFNEAVEMKQALMRDFDVPEGAILIDPHARHTTTNLRNAARILYRDGFPLDKPALITGDIYQSQYIESQEFADRCLQEQGYSLARKLTRVSDTDLEWQPNYVASLTQDARDPLDP
jgi:hypothetical protein